MTAMLPEALQVKLCSKCGETKALTEFFRRRGKPKGVRSECKACTWVPAAAWRRANPERARAAGAAWLAANKQRKRATNAAWSAENREIKRAYNIEWHRSNRERNRVTNAAWSAANPERKRAYGVAHENRRRARKFAAPDVDPAVKLSDVIALWGTECYICGVTTDPAAPARSRFRAELEHVLPLAKGGAHNLENLRCVCHPCNQVKGARFTPEDVRSMFT